MLGSQKYQEERYRFVIIIVYVIAALVNSLPVHTFSSINVLIEHKFNISSQYVTLNALLFTIAHPLFAVPCNWFINKHGMKLSFIIGSVFVIAGVWMRLLLENGQPIYCLLGSFLAAIGNIFILNTPSKVAISWFSKERVNIVTFTGILASLLSITVGASVPGYIFDGNTTEGQFRTFLMIEALIVTVPLVALSLLFRNNPQKPPSKAAQTISNQKPVKYK